MTACSVPGCGKTVVARSWCAAHYRRWKVHGDPSICTKEKNEGLCKVAGCSGVSRSRGMCSKHYERWRIHRDPLWGDQDHQPSICRVEGCERVPSSLGLCNSHYGRLRRHGDPLTNSPRWTEERKQMMSHKMKGRPLSDAARQAIQSNEALGRRRASIRKAFQDPELLQRISCTSVQMHRTMSEEVRRARSLKIADASRRYWSSLTPEARTERNRPFIEAGHIATTSLTVSSIEIMVRRELETLGVQYVPQMPIGPYRVDVFVPAQNLVIECDGEYWHNRPGVPERDALRNEFLMSRGFAVFRLLESEIRSDAKAAVLRALNRKEVRNSAI